jgi:hypothetical protein
VSQLTVDRRNLNGRFNPEAAFIERHELAHTMCRLANRLENAERWQERKDDHRGKELLNG